MAPDKGVYEGPLRDLWEFPFRTQELLDAARKRQTNHEDHAKYWDLLYSKWNVEMESTAQVETVKITGGEQRVLRYDQGLQQKVNDAVSRRAAHQNKAEQYARWVLALEKRLGVTINLRITDVAFFYAPLEALPNG